MRPVRAYAHHETAFKKMSTDPRQRVKLFLNIAACWSAFALAV